VSSAVYMDLQTVGCALAVSLSNLGGVIFLNTYYFEYQCVELYNFAKLSQRGRLLSRMGWFDLNSLFWAFIGLVGLYVAIGLLGKCQELLKLPVLRHLV